ncbi:MAG: hypothetical protein RR753_03505, partial [Raoultibacter sp.]
MKKSKKSNRGLALVLAVVLALTPMAGFPLTALATGDTATSQADAPAAAVSALVGEGDVIIDENSFPDPAFRSFVSSEEFDKNNDGVLQRAELLAVTSIEFYYNSLVTNPEGIEFFTNLTTLRCFQDSLTALDLTKNTALTTLYCRANFTLDLSSNTGLEELELKSSVCSSVDLTQNTKLKKLTLGLTGEMFEGPAVPLDLSHNKELTCLEIDEASMWLTSLDLSNNAELTELICWYNSLAALDLSHNTKLTQVYCNNEYARVFWARQGSGYVCNLNSVKGFKNLDKVSNMKIINERQQDIPFTFDTQTGEIKVDERPGHVFYIYDTGSAVVTGNSSFFGDLYPYFTYGITATDDGNGSISPAGTTVVREGIDEKTYTFQPNPGYELGSVTVDGKPVTITNNTYTFTDVHADTTIHATFKALPTYNITATVGANGALVVGGNGMLDPSGIVKVQEKTDQSFTIKPNDGYELDTLLVDNVDAKSELQGNTYTFTDVRAAHSIAVTFAAIAEPPKPPTPIVYYYNVTATVENGTITPFGTIAVREGSSQAYTFAPNEGYEFATVSVNGEAVTSSDSNAYTLTDVRAVTAIHVTFKEIPVPPKPPVTPTDPVDPPKPPVTPTDPVDPPKPPTLSVPDNG